MTKQREAAQENLESRADALEEAAALFRGNALAHQVFARDAVLTGNFPGAERFSGAANAYSDAAKIIEVLLSSSPKGGSHET